MEGFKEETLEIINDLLEAIDWLGGDPYEMDAIQSSRNKAEDFLEKHQS